ncbi:hypothetical protein HPG69_008869 [Diceros bicornis minor]|uniref:G-protein coupled receptors family 1 profile domain-containing protein n=1 Tax=Diceros bicornis minor TaxID=77932 RepID=A0A7J7FAW1_DICBM|nr:hypothetical protein HPG69_008869 [Diceros bicornis minor]
MVMANITTMSEFLLMGFSDTLIYQLAFAVHALGFLLHVLAWAEVTILTVMSHDLYAAICLPLHHKVIMNPRTCKCAVIAVWLSEGISGILYTAATLSHSLLKLSCFNDYLGVIGGAAFMSVMAFVCFISIVLSYIHIFSAVLRIPSAEGSSKFLKPTSDIPIAFDLIVSTFYIVIPPKLNLISYSLKNETMKGALRKLLLGSEFTRKKNIFVLLLMVVQYDTQETFLVIGIPSICNVEEINIFLYIFILENNHCHYGNFT